MRKQFRTINEGFLCEYCGFFVPSRTKSCRNHCSSCLWSKHVDSKVPGDRLSDCGGIMEPKTVERKGSEYILVHICTRCGVTKRNMAAPDDNFDVLRELSSTPIIMKKG
ncbi:MAG TPA: RNHCP domain-containing protein [Patescibacteria group bacterium]|nr:RNHCP domain-containing protein [Patescibacteria group bacterium]